jgi:Sec7-like guanine-nucleotide exchange factor
MRGLSPKIILGDPQRSENTQTHTNKHTRPNMKFKLKLLQIKCHVLGSYNRQRPKCASKDNQSFCKSVYLSRSAHALRPRREWTSSNDLHLRVPVGNPTLLGLDLPLTALVGIARRRRKILTCTQINKITRAKLERLHSARLIRRNPKATNSRHARLQVK